MLFLIQPPKVEAQQMNALSSKEKKKGWKLLFNGVDFDGWQTPSGNSINSGWQVQNGLMNTIKGNKGGDIITKNEFSNFELIIDFNIEDAGNSGVKYYYTKYDVGGNLGMEYQILDDKNAEDNKKENHLTGSLYDVIPPDEAKKKLNPTGQWNTLRIVSKNNKVEHWLNGMKILTFVRGGDSFTKAVALSKFSKAVPTFGTVEKGHILLQEHGSQVSFRNIKIKKL